MAQVRSDVQSSNAKELLDVIQLFMIKILLLMINFVEHD